MCTQDRIVSQLQCYMDDLTDCLEEFVKKFLLVFSLAMGALVVMVMFVLKLIVDRACSRNTSETTGIGSVNRNNQLRTQNLAVTSNLQNTSRSESKSTTPRVEINELPSAPGTKTISLQIFTDSSPDLDEQFLKKIDMSALSKKTRSTEKDTGKIVHPEIKQTRGTEKDTERIVHPELKIRGTEKDTGRTVHPEVKIRGTEKVTERTVHSEIKKIRGTEIDTGRIFDPEINKIRGTEKDTGRIGHPETKKIRGTEKDTGRIVHPEIKSRDMPFMPRHTQVSEDTINDRNIPKSLKSKHSRISKDHITTAQSCSNSTELKNSCCSICCNDDKCSNRGEEEPQKRYRP